MLLAPVHMAEAQTTRNLPRIGYLSRDSAEGHKGLLAAFQQGLRELGYVEGQNITFEYRYAERKPERLAALAAELVKLKVDIIVSGAGSSGVRAARKATTVIPIVFTSSADPVGSGLVASLAHPGGNVTGLSDYHRGLVTKRLELLKEVAPSISRVAVLFNPSQRSNQPMLKDFHGVAAAFDVTLLELEAEGPDAIDRAFTTISNERPRSLWVLAGDLMSYAADREERYHGVATCVDKILKRTKPSDLPVQRPTKFELVINFKTAKQMGVTISQSVLYRADRVIR